MLLWDVASGWQVSEFAAPQPGHPGHVDVGFTPDGLGLIVGAVARTEVWDLATRKTQGQPSLNLPAGPILAIRPDGKLLALGCVDGSLKLADIGAEPLREKTYPLFPKGGSILKVAFIPEGRYLATANPDGTVYVLRLAERGVVFQAPAAP